MTRVIATTIIAAFGLLFIGCDAEEHVRVVKNSTPSPYKDLTEKWHVLENMRLSYTRMEWGRYLVLLDPNFVAWFRPADVSNYGLPESWGLWEEGLSATEMLGKDGGRYDNPVLSISFQLADIEGVTWTEVDPGVDFPGETWYSTVVSYQYFIDTTKDVQYITAGSPSAEFTVRQQADNTWRLVVWRDLFDGGRTALPGASTEETTWGRLKWLYYAPERS